MLNKFSAAVIAISFAISGTSFAEWTKAYSCDQDRFVVDIKPSGGPRAVVGQMVLRDQLADWIVYDQRLINENTLNNAGEIVLKTNYDERGNLNLRASFTGPERNLLCLKFFPGKNKLVILKGSIGSYCAHGEELVDYKFHKCEKL